MTGSSRSSCCCCFRFCLPPRRGRKTLGDYARLTTHCFIAGLSGVSSSFARKCAAIDHIRGSVKTQKQGPCSLPSFLLLHAWCLPRARVNLSFPYLPGIPCTVRFFFFLPFSASDRRRRRCRRSLAIATQFDSREFYVPTREERGGRYSSKKVMSRPRYTAHTRARHFSLSLSLSFAIRASSRLASRTDDRVYLVKVMCTASSAVVNKMYAGAEHARARARSNDGEGEESDPICARHIRSTLRDCKYGSGRRARRAQWRNDYRVNGRPAGRNAEGSPDANIRKNHLLPPGWARALFGVHHPLYVICARGGL